MQELSKELNKLDISENDNMLSSSSDQLEFDIDSAFELLLLPSTTTSTIPSALLNYVCRNGNIFLKDKRFLSLSIPVLKEILKQDTLQVHHEAIVLDAVIRWGQHQCGSIPDKKSPEKFGPQILELLPLVRHPIDLSPKFWQYTWFNKGDDDNMMANVLQYHEIQPYNTILRVGCSVHAMSFARVNKDLTLVPRPAKQKGLPLQEELEFLVNAPYILYAITLTEGVFGENFTKNVYMYENLTMKLKLCWDDFQTEPKVIIKPHTGNHVEFALDKPVDLVAGKWIKIAIHVSGFISEIRKTTRVTKKVWVDKSNIMMATAMSTENSSIYVPSTPSPHTTMMLPQICMFRRDSTPESNSASNKMSIRQGYLDELIVGYNKTGD